MLTTAILNVVLALGVIVMVVAPLIWAVVTQHRDHPQLAVNDGATARPSQGKLRIHAAQPSYKTVVGRA